MTKVNDQKMGFERGTEVLMHDGKWKHVEQIQPGDWVMSFDTRSSNSPLEPREVIDIVNYQTREILEVDSGEDVLRVARGQLFLTPGLDWKIAHETAHVTDIDGNARSVEIRRIDKGIHNIHDIIVDDNHSLVANGFRVHNSLGGSATDSGGATGGSSSGGSPTQGGSVDGPNPSNGGNMNSGYGGRGGGSVSGAGNGNGNSGGNGNDGGGGDTSNGAGGRGNGPRDSFGGGSRYQGRSGRGSKGRYHEHDLDKKKKKPKIDYKVNAITAYQTMQASFDSLCNLMTAYKPPANFFTVRTVVTDTLNTLYRIGNDAVNNITLSDMSSSDKNQLQVFHADILNLILVINNSWSNVNEMTVNTDSIIRACLDTKMFIDRQLSVIGKYTGSQAQNYYYRVPTPMGIYAPWQNLDTIGLQQPVAPAYVKTSPNVYVTTSTTVTPPTTGGVGASYTNTRVVRGYIYGFRSGKGWVRLGPADQYRNIS